NGPEASERERWTQPIPLVLVGVLLPHPSAPMRQSTAMARAADRVFMRTPRVGGPRRLGGGPYTSAFPPSVISATFMVGEEAVSSKHKSFPTMTMFLSISSEVEATVIPSTGKAMCPFSIQNPAAW